MCKFCDYWFFYFIYLFFSRLEKRTCLFSLCYLPSMVSNASLDQSFWPSHRPEIIYSCIQRPGALVVHHRRYFFYVKYPNRPANADSSTPFYRQLTKKKENYKCANVMIPHPFALFFLRQSFNGEKKTTKTKQTKSIETW